MIESEREIDYGQTDLSRFREINKQIKQKIKNFDKIKPEINWTTQEITF